MADFDLDEAPQESKPREERKRYEYVTMEYKSENVLRVVDKKGKSAKTFWFKDGDGNSKCVKLPEQISPETYKAIVDAKDSGGNKKYKISTTNYLKVVDAFGKLRIYGFTSQVAKGIKKISLELNADGKDITQVDILVKRGKKGDNPLYEVSLAKLDADEKALRDKAIKRLIESSDFKLDDAIKPWDERTIRDRVLGLSSSAPVAKKTETSKPAADSEEDAVDDDFSAFDKNEDE